MTPIYSANPTPRFTPVSSAYTEWPHFLENLNLKLKYFGALCAHFQHILTSLWWNNSILVYKRYFWMSVIGNFELSHRKSPRFLLGPHERPPFFPHFYTNRPLLSPTGRAYSEHLGLRHFGQKNLAQARNNPWVNSFFLYPEVKANDTLQFLLKVKDIFFFEMH